MQKAQRNKFWSPLLIGSLIITIVLMFSYWHFVPRELRFSSLFGYNRTTAESKFYFPPEPVPEELKLKRGAPFIYQILH